MKKKEPKTLTQLTAWIGRRHSQLSAVISLAPDPIFVAIDEQVARRVERIFRAPRRLAKAGLKP